MNTTDSRKLNAELVIKFYNCSDDMILKHRLTQTKHTFIEWEMLPHLGTT